MAWDLFKSLMLPMMQSNAFGSDMSAFARNFTIAYDSTIKSGGDVVNGIPIIKGNVELMESTLFALLQQTQFSKNTTLLDVIGPVIIGYWTGATLSLVPTPIIPAIGSIKNIATISGTVLSPGNWTPLPVIPNNDSNIFLNAFIQSANIHLMTVSGIFSVISQYPPPAPPAPGVVNWVSYKV